MEAKKKTSILDELDIPFSDIDDDALVEQLTAEELEELNAAIDPENALLPVHERQPNQTTKAPTGPYQREKLLAWLEEQAKNAPPPDPNYIEYEKKVRGNVFTPKTPVARAESPLEDFPEELADVLDTASEEDILELAAILGIHGMVTQKQSRYAEDIKKGQSLRGSGLKKYTPGIVRTKHYKMKKEDQFAVNELDLPAAMEKLKANDPELTSLNLNNHKDVTPDILSEVAECVVNNPHLKELLLANTRMNDTTGMMFVEAMRENKTLEVLNLESNFLQGDTIKELMSVLETNTTLKEIRLANQCSMMGYQVEEEIAKCLEKNHTILKFGLSFENRGPRVLVNEYLIRNNDGIRVERNDEADGAAGGQEEEEEGDE